MSSISLVLLLTKKPHLCYALIQFSLQNTHYMKDILYTPNNHHQWGLGVNTEIKRKLHSAHVVSRVLPTSQVGYYADKPIESVVYCLNIIYIITRIAPQRVSSKKRSPRIYFMTLDNLLRAIYKIRIRVKNRSMLSLKMLRTLWACCVCSLYVLRYNRHQVVAWGKKQWKTTQKLKD